MVFRVEATQGNTVRLVKTVAYHSSRGVPVKELSDRCDRTLDRAAHHDVDHYHAGAARLVRRVLGGVRRRISGAEGTPERDELAVQQAIRFNLFSLAQATARADQQGVARQGRHRVGLRGPLLLGHRDLRRPVPHLHACRTSPGTCCTSAAGCCRPRGIAPARWRRAARSSRGARSTARRPRPTTPPAPRRCTSTPTSPTRWCSTSPRPATAASWSATASTSSSRPRGCGPTSGFWRSNGGEPSFHIHGVTGPDEYTTVVNNNLFTNVMARYNLEQDGRGARADRATEDPAAYAQVVARLGLERRRGRGVGALRRGDDHPVRRGPRHPPAGRLLPRPRGVGPLQDPGRAAAAAPALPPAGDLPVPGAQAGRRRARAVPPGRPVHARRRSAPTSSTTTRSPPATRRCRRSCSRSSRPRSATTRSRWRYFLQGLYVDLMNLHEQHRRRPAHRLGRRRVGGARLRLRGHARPRRAGCPSTRGSPTRGARSPSRSAGAGRGCGSRSGPTSLEIANEGDADVEVTVRGTSYDVTAGGTVAVDLDGHGAADRRAARATSPLIGGTRADGTTITAGVPDPIPFEDHQELGPADVPLVDPPI